MSGPIFEAFFHDPLYLDFKNYLYNYRMRCAAIQAEVDLALTPILEIGSGVSPILSGSDQVMHSDLSFQAMRHLLQAGSTTKAFVSEAERVSIADGSVGTIVCSEVLEHIPNDLEAMREFYRMIRPGGRLILTVPVHQYFFSYDDRAVGHHRRYKPATLIAELRRIGFSDFKVQTVAGLADKIGMLGATLAFGLLPARKSSGGSLRHALPLYRVLNKIYGAVAMIEAHIIPQSLATIVLIRANRA